MDTIYLFTWTDKDGKHSATVVGSKEFNDQASYLSTLEQAGMIWDIDVNYEGEDI